MLQDWMRITQKDATVIMPRLAERGLRLIRPGSAGSTPRAIAGGTSAVEKNSKVPKFKSLIKENAMIRSSMRDED
jgi:hypothetical protein